MAIQRYNAPCSGEGAVNINLIASKLLQQFVKSNEVTEMKKVTVYQAIDGSVHETEEQCCNHEQKVNLESWYEAGNELLGSYMGSRVYYDELVEWLVRNEDVVKEILKQHGN